MMLFFQMLKGERYSPGNDERVCRKFEGSTHIQDQQVLTQIKPLLHLLGSNSREGQFAQKSLTAEISPDNI